MSDPSTSTLHFLLVPDGASARRAQRVLATEGSRLGVIAGTWEQLINTAANAYLIGPTKITWQEAVETGMREMAGGFRSAVAGSTTGPRIHISRSSEESGRLQSLGT